jgi:hypothetical protein
MELRDLAYQSLVEFSAALDAQDDDFAVESPAQEYAGVIFTRLKATFQAIALLLENGYLDEAVMLIRRQTEDSLRLHYMYAHRDIADGLALDFMRWREELVLKPMDRIINNDSLSKELRDQVKPMAAARRRRIEDLRDSASEAGVELHRFPTLEEIASELNRHADMIAYASEAEVSHSALSAVTTAYTAQETPGSTIFVDERSKRPTEVAAFTRSAINSTGIAVMFALRLLGLDEDASRIANVGSALQLKLKAALDSLG